MNSTHLLSTTAVMDIVVICTANWHSCKRSCFMNTLKGMFFFNQPEEITLNNTSSC